MSVWFSDSDRLDELIVEADYRSADEAVADASRLAVLAMAKGAATEREAVRSRAVRAANIARDPQWRAARPAGTGHRFAFVAAIVLGALAVALVAISPRTGSAAVGLQEGTLIAGSIAFVAAALFVWLEPRRASGELFGSHVPATLYLVFVVVWWGFVASVLVLRGGEIDRHEPGAVIVGLVLFAASGTTLVVLWRRGRRADRSETFSLAQDPARGLIDPVDAPAVYRALDEWWRAAGAAAEARDDDWLVVARASALARLRHAGYISERDEQRALISAKSTWKERRR